MRVAALTAFLLAAQGGAHDVITTKLTYSRDISRIFANRCISCHGANDAIPLATFPQVRPWAVDIKEQVLARQMPPWGAVKGFGSFAPDTGLTEEELLIIAGWVVGGAPEGDPATLPHSVSAGARAQSALLRDGLLVNVSKRLTQDVLIAGIKPESAVIVPSARIVATTPDGRKQPLLWLFRFDPKWKQVFRFREPLRLPAGSIVTSDVPLLFALETADPR